MFFVGQQQFSLYKPTYKSLAEHHPPCNYALWFVYGRHAHHISFNESFKSLALTDWNTSLKARYVLLYVECWWKDWRNWSQLKESDVWVYTAYTVLQSVTIAHRSWFSNLVMPVQKLRCCFNKYVKNWNITQVSHSNWSSIHKKKSEFKSHVF